MTPDSSQRSAPPPEKDPARRGPRLAIALGAVAVLAAVALLSRGSPQDSGKPEAGQAAAPAPQPSGSAQAATGKTGPGEPVQAESRPQ